MPAVVVESELASGISAMTIKEIFRQDIVVKVDETPAADDQISPVLKSLPPPVDVNSSDDFSIATPPRPISNMTARKQMTRSALSQDSSITAETTVDIPITSSHKSPKQPRKKKQSWYKIIKRKLLKKRKKHVVKTLQQQLLDDPELLNRMYVMSHKKLAMNRSLAEQVLISNLIVDLLKLKTEQSTDGVDTGEQFQKERERIIKKRDRQARKSSKRKRQQLILQQSSTVRKQKSLGGDDDSWKLLWMDKRYHRSGTSPNDEQEDDDDFIIEERRHKTKNALKSETEEDDDELTPLGLLSKSSK